MFGNVNKTTLMGNLGKDPEMRRFPDGTPIASFTVATNEYWTDKKTGERKSKTEWHNVQAFGAAATVVEKTLKKGMKVYLSGPSRTRKWEDQNKVTRSITEVIVEFPRSDLEILDDRDDKPGNGADYGQYYGDDSKMGDDIPF